MELKPFLQWVGGKRNLLPEIKKYYRFEEEKIKYVEPFVGAGAVLLDILTTKKVEKALITDISPELINCWNTIKTKPEKLLFFLTKYKEEFQILENKEERKLLFYQLREKFNNLETNSPEKAALMIVLNKKGFNGLWRVNSKGKYNVPFGIETKNQIIFEEENIIEISKFLQNVEIKNVGYENTFDFIDKNTFVYLDPPYLPLDKTKSFTSYSKNGFTIENQIELADFIDKISEKGAKFLLSDSDPKNIEPENDFFDKLYKKYYIQRIPVRRNIAAKKENRGIINEILVSNIKI